MWRRQNDYNDDDDDDKCTLLYCILLMCILFFLLQAQSSHVFDKTGNTSSKQLGWEASRLVIVLLEWDNIIPVLSNFIFCVVCGECV